MSPLLIGCGYDRLDSRLVRIDSMMDDNPQGALDSLARIDRNGMSEWDSFYYELLKIKATDKAYVRHESDSAVVKVIDYYKSHGDRDIYAEALYYGGRVYSDLGDYPTSLRYFQDALDRLPDDTDKQKLRGHALSQTGRLLNKLRLYDEAKPYLHEVIALDSIHGDSLNLVYDIQLLGSVLMNAGDYAQSRSCFLKSKELAENVIPENVPVLKMYLAAIDLYDGDVSNAIQLISEAMATLPVGYQDEAYAYAAKIFLKSGNLDRVGALVDILVRSSDPSYRLTGYKLLFSSDLIDGINTDSLKLYVEEYDALIDVEMNLNGSEQVIMQDSFYNYRMHETKREKAERNRDNIWALMTCVVVLSLILGIIVVYLKYRNKVQLIKLHEALDLISSLRGNTKEIEKTGNEESYYDTEIRIVAADINGLRQRLRGEILSFQNEVSVSEEILRSVAYSNVMEYLKLQKPIPEKSELWDELNSIVNSASHDFMHNINLLSGGKLKSQDVRLCVLIKCGFLPIQIAVLLGLTKGAISYRRGNLCEKLFGQKLETKELDNIIRAL